MPQLGVVGLTQGAVIGLIAPPGMKGGAGVSSENSTSDSGQTEYVMSPLCEIQAQVDGCVSRATFPVLATVKLASPSISLTFVAHSSRGVPTFTSTFVPRTPTVPCGVLNW